MSVDRKTVDRIAELSRLEFKEGEKEGITKDLNKMLDFVSVLEEVDTTGVEALVYVMDEKPVLREDKVLDQLSQEKALVNAPLKDTDFIKVPKVIERD